MATYYGTNGNDQLVGTFYADTFFLYGGNDEVDAGNGDDYISAGTGNDTVLGGDGDDAIYGGDGIDFLFGELGEDTIYGGDGDDIIDGGLENDRLYGDAGDDIFLVDGVTGMDSYTGGTGFDQIGLIEINPYALWGEIGISYLSGVERIANVQSVKAVDIRASGVLDLSAVEVDGIRKIVGSNGSDTITGTSNLYSSSLNDTIDGEGGNDYLAGGLGNDTLIGGSGIDTFIFGANEGSDTVEDFADGIDLIDVRGTSANAFADLSIIDNGVGSAIVSVDGTIIELEGIAVSSLDESDFLF